ncbi:MAG: hypothetical protein IJV68_06485 [Clostridia bacterium]|nr:hypothetical protein [Clostridia bacterium]
MGAIGYSTDKGHIKGAVFEMAAVNGGCNDKRYIFMPKTGAVKPKGIFYRGGK